LKYFINFSLITFYLKGLYPVPEGASDILGLEGSFRINLYIFIVIIFLLFFFCIAVGIVHQESHSSNSKWKKNDRVMALLGGGGNAEYVAVDERNLIRIPDWMSFRDAGAIPEVWLTAFQLLYWVSSVTTSNTQEEIRKKRILVHAGASGVGTSVNI
jgi:tumor protein p53-inducible protein 3